MTEKRLSHAYMLVGPADDVRREAMLRLEAELLCSQPGEGACGRCRDCRKVFEGVHPDVIAVERQPGDKGQLHREILVDQIRDAAADAVVAPNEAARKVYVIPEADKMNTAAQNALLKALEDPPGHACFLLCTTAADALLPTVRSRCVRVDRRSREEELPELSDLARSYIELAAGTDGAEMTRFCLLRGKLSREETEALLDEIDGALCDIQCGRRPDPGIGRAGLFRLSALMERSRDYLRHNVAPKQVFGVLAAETIE